MKLIISLFSYFSNLISIGLTFHMSQTIRDPHGSLKEIRLRLMDTGPHMAGCECNMMNITYFLALLNSVTTPRE